MSNNTATALLLTSPRPLVLMRNTSGPSVLTFAIRASCSAIASLQTALQNGVDLLSSTALVIFPVLRPHPPLNTVPFIAGEDDPAWGPRPEVI